MENFVFQSPTKIIFGKNTEKEVGRAIKEFGKKVLFHYGGGSIKKSGLFDKIVESLNEAGIKFVELSGVQPNPRLSLVEQGIKVCREEEIDAILAVGGGSVIDSAKAISMGVPYQGDVWDFFEGKAVPKEVLPLGTILTIPATGSEASRSCVITKEEGWYKRAVNDDIIRPKFAVMNPEITYTLPAYQTASGIVDIMSHVIERYFTNVRNVDFTDKLCEATLKTVIKNATIVLKEPDNYPARAEIMWTGTIAHNELLSTGRIGDWGSHKIDHELSGIYDVAHGAGLAVVMPAWMKYVYKHDVNRFTQFAVNVWNVEYYFEDPERSALEGIKRMEEFFKSLGMPTTLTEMNIPTDRFEEMAHKCVETPTKSVGNFIPLKKEDVLNILNLAK